MVTKKEQTLEIEQLLVAGELSQEEIAQRFNISNAWVWQIKRRMEKPSRESSRMWQRESGFFLFLATQCERTRGD
jgi:transcriptional regulator with XRE-family HTH domain